LTRTLSAARPTTTAALPTPLPSTDANDTSTPTSPDAVAAAVAEKARDGGMAVAGDQVGFAATEVLQGH
jgi:hypothetical protein